MKSTIKSVLILLLANLMHYSSFAQENTTEENSTIYIPASRALYDTLAQLDSIFFESFNNRDLETQKKMFSTDVEFYHDNGGLIKYDQVIENTKKLFDQNNGLKRTLIPGSLEVYPIKDYGAVAIGMHRFCHLENGKDDCGTFKFVNVWQRQNGTWKLARVISYDH